MPLSIKKINYELLPNYLDQKIKHLELKYNQQNSIHEIKCKQLDEKFYKKMQYYNKKIEGSSKNIKIKENKLEKRLKYNAFQRLRFTSPIGSDIYSGGEYENIIPVQRKSKVNHPRSNILVKQSDILLVIIGILFGILIKLIY